LTANEDFGCVTGFTATIKIGINAHNKEEAVIEVKKYIKALEGQIPIWLVGVE